MFFELKLFKRRIKRRVIFKEFDAKDRVREFLSIIKIIKVVNG